MKCLIVDNDRDLCSNLCEFLENQDFVCHQKHTLKDAISFIQAHWQELDLIFLDIIFPEDECGGFALKRLINGFNRKIPVIFMTGLSLGSLYQSSRELGAIALLKKPFDFSAINRVIEKSKTFKNLSNAFEIKPIANLGLYLEGEIVHYFLASTVTIGRNCSCNIQIPSYFDYCSQIHCMLVRIYEERSRGQIYSFYRLVDGTFDKSSSNGIYVNEIKLKTKTCDLRDGDIIKIPLYRNQGQLQFATLYYELIDKREHADEKATLV